MKWHIFGLLVLLFLVSPAFGEDFQVDESLFEDSAFEVASNELVSTNLAEEKEGLEISGGINLQMGQILNRDFLTGKTDNNRFSSSTGAFVLADVRLKQGIRGFAHLDASYNPAGTNELTWGMKELFVDLNVEKRVFFRVGKQVLQWGRGYLWNPTDLVNVEKKSFTNLFATCEGNYGFKMQIPFGTLFNIYAYAKLGKETLPTDLAFSTKVEVLVGNTEIALSTRVKRGDHPVFGVDFSSAFFGWDIYGEASLADWDGNQHLRFVQTNVIMGSLTNQMELAQSFELTNGWIPKVSLGVSRSFDLLDVQDRLSLTLEGFYNGAGYTNLTLDTTNRQLAFFGGGYYHAGEYGQWYGACFLTVRQLGLSELSGNLNAIVNLSDNSALISLGLTYTPVDHFTLSFSLNGAVGEENREYTFYGNGLNGNLSTGLVF